MLIKACLNGGTTRSEHSSVPQTPEELAVDARAAHQAGAGAVHMHPRDSATAAETLDPDAVLASVAAVRTAVPGVPVGVTTGIWTVGGDPARRLELVARWTGRDRPDFASVNVAEPGTDELADLLTSLGIAIEAGVWSAADADLLAASSFADRAIRVLIEPEDEAGADAVATAAAADAALDRHGIDVPRVHHGYGLATWDVIRAALAHGRDIRVGLEDTTVLPGGSRAAGNGDLVAAAVRLAAGS